MQSLLIVLIIFFFFNAESECQSIFNSNLNKDFKERLSLIKPLNSINNSAFKKFSANYPPVGNNFLRRDKTQTTSSTFPIAIGVASFLYLFNPIVLFENDKIALGFTKEASIGFGPFGEHRFSFEYSYIFRKDLNSNIRAGYKYDILLQPGIQPSNIMQGSTTISLGGGYFNNFSRPGYFAETTYGYSIRNDKILFYPSIKFRYTYVVKGSDIYDLSLGIIIGIANPFIDLKIRNKHE